MTDKYADLRDAVIYFDSGELNGMDWIVLANPDTIRALLADYDRMRDALASIIDIAARPAVIEIASAALAQEGP